MRMRALVAMGGLLAVLSVSTITLAQDQGASPQKDAAVTAVSDAKPAAAGTETEKPKVAAPSSVSEPGDPQGAIDSVKTAVAAAKQGQWWYFSALLLMIVMFLLKWVGHKDRVGYWQKLGRWRYVISPVLSLGAALLAAFEGGASFETALGVFTSAYATSSLQELWEHGILNKPRESTLATRGRLAP